MRVYFLSEGRAVLRLDGEYAGTTDSFPRFADISGDAFAEWLPHCGAPACFYLSEDIFENPPQGICAATAQDERFLYACAGGNFYGFEVSDQREAGGTLYTLLKCGGTYLACDGLNCALHPLRAEYDKAYIQPFTLDGVQYAAVRGRGRLAAVRDAELIFEGRADEFDGESGEISLSLNDCAESLCTFGVLEPERRRIEPRRTPTAAVMHFAFFESVMNGGDSAQYLCEELKGRAGELKGYLGPFCAVVPPTQAARERYGNGIVGLVYRKRQRVFEIKWFCTESEGGLISNIYPAE